MASSNFSPSNLLAGQAKFNGGMLGAEWRLPDIAAVKTSQLGNVANPSLAQLRTIETRSVNAYFPIRQTATGGTVRSHEHTGENGDSLAEAIAWTTLSEPFSISRKLSDNNVYDFAEMYASSLRNAIFNLLNRIDVYFVTQLLADKTKVNVGGGNGSFDGTLFDYQVAQDAKANWFQNVKAMMEQNLYRSNLIGIVDSQGYVLAQDKAAQGSNNGVNTAFQFMGFDSLNATTRALLDNPTTYTESGLFFEPGLVASLPWIPVQNRKALDAEKAMTFNGDYGQISIPELGVDFAIHAYTKRSNTTSLNGYTQDETLEVEVSTDWGYVSAPSSTTDESPVFSSGVLA